MIFTKSGSVAAVFLIASFLYPASVTAAAAAFHISNREATTEEVGYMPEEGSTPNTNPPAMAWLNERDATSWTLQIARDATFAIPAVQVDDWPYLLYTHTEPLATGHYFWRYRFANTSGTLSDWSTPRQFDVSSTATIFPRPSAGKLWDIISEAHPRMYMKPENLAALRKTVSPENPQLKSLLKEADAALTASLMAEPKPWTNNTWNAGEWGEYLRQASRSTAQMDTLAFAWLLTGRNEYGQAAKSHLMNFAAWNPAGPSSMAINDEVGMPVLHSMSRTYDWIFPLLDSENRAAVLSSIHARGQETYEHLRREPYEQFAYNSHNGRMWHFLGEAGLAFYGEIPEAETWLNYAMTIFYGWYPIWGKQDGGWAEGMWYWSSYNTRVTWWLDLMHASLGIDSTDKPFYSHVGDFPLYVCPPGNPVAGFGDFSERPPPAQAVGEPMAAYALYKQNSAWKWYADKTGVKLEGGPFDYLRSLRKQPEAKAPENLPLLKIFPEVGYALFHSRLTDPASNIHVAMRCSPFGNVSHSHNDQNAIVMSAYGEPLLVNTGTRDFYGSDFCKQYYWQTIAHNSILFDGKGQVRARNTQGAFVASGEEPGKLAYVVGDATKAYAGLVDKYRRWLIFLPDSGALMIDEIQTTATTATLLFHGRATFSYGQGVAAFSNAPGNFSLTKGNVVLDGNIQVWPSIAQVEFSQSDHYPIPLGNNKKPLFDEWHLKAEIQLEKKYNHSQYIVTWLNVVDNKKKSESVSWQYQWAENNVTISHNQHGQIAPAELKIDFNNLTAQRTK